MLVSIELGDGAHTLSGEWLRRGVARLPGCRLLPGDSLKLTLASPDAMDKRGPLGTETAAAASGRAIIRIGSRSGGLPYHSMWSGSRSAGEGGGFWHILDTPANAVLSFLGAIPNVHHVHATVIRPAGDPFGAFHGPIDALDFDDAACSAPPPLPGLTVSWQAIMAQHTRCWMIALTADLREELTTDWLLDALRRTRRILLVPAHFGLDSTAALLELFRDIGRWDLCFPETVVFPHQMTCTGRRLQCWIAAHDMNQVVEALTCATEVLSPEGGRAAARRRVDAATEVLEGLP